ncbi:hypothetical protein Tsubulata_008020 [Turnera subulata]|uniref:Uncharacterized protein n=1 Tax=Turnera subulata TaxID=218843 RepID=A0A9Q0FRJ0_9ROSI|nr:hypothetical protein Tsubulata_008020 [Turnera subulata]
MEDFICQGKKAWPELVGAKGEEAAAIIEKENPNVNAIIVLEGSPITLDYRCDRVRVFVDENGIVVSAPEIS